MADKPFKIRLITPEARVLDGEAAYVSLPMHDGQMGFMAGRAAIVGKLGSGELRVELVDRYEVGVKLQEAGNKRWFVSGGFVQMVGDTLTILATEAVAVEDLQPAKIRAELESAQSRTSTDTVEMDRITADRNRARAKLALTR